MNYIADLHIHSRFSMASSPALTLPHLASWAIRKGISVLASGDFTHPQWRREIFENLRFDESSGLYKPVFKIDAPDGRAPFFCLQSEISCIYKRDGKTRKVHNLVFMPNLEAAENFSQKLAAIGNIASDGRPILGLDSRDLLEIALETSSEAVLIPAHIWTPWFSVFGSRSGFDSLEECYGDLAPHIFALETGLSSDPPMNRLCASLDSYALISNSDAHSGPNLGREANLFAGAPSWNGMFDSLRRAAKREADPETCGFLGTLEFYPEEGKYHLDGHRACNVVLCPEEAKALRNICPVCGKPLTIGVLHRVNELATRKEPASLVNEPKTRMLAPLPEVVGQILSARPRTSKVEQKCLEIVANLGPELDVLCLKNISEIRAFWEPLGEAIARIRANKIRIDAGFDGKYGRIEIFEPGELPK